MKMKDEKDKYVVVAVSMHPKVREMLKGEKNMSKALVNAYLSERNLKLEERAEIVGL